MKVRGLIACIAIAIGCYFISSIDSHAYSLNESEYVTFSPDGQAFTTNAGDKNCVWYELGMYVNTGVSSTIRLLNEGEHYYKSARTGKIPVGKWEVAYRTGNCCHNSYPLEGAFYHGIEFGRQKCLAFYYSGWKAFCADCGEEITHNLIYMSKEAAQSITQLDMGLTYYYLCPFCSNLEQGVLLEQHLCTSISWNLYHVIYSSNADGIVGGYMEKSIHTYNNEPIYEGEVITPAIRLNKNTFTRIGYEFVGWNTKPDGSGQSFRDCQEVKNLSTENFNGIDKGIVTLYAQWKKSESTLNIDPNGGLYDGKRGITSYQGDYGSSRKVSPSLLQAPDGYTVKFDSRGGKAAGPVTGKRSFQEWRVSQPFYGKMKDNTYTFLGTEGQQDTITAEYGYDSIVLPATSRTGSSFGGWYYDQTCEKPAGAAGDRITPDKDMTLYAKWVDLVLFSQDNYTADKGRGAVDLSWEQNDGNTKSYLIYQSRDNKNWVQVSDSEDISNTNKVDRTFTFSGAARTMTIPYTGLYTITAYGAQGGNYGSCLGGCGGKVTGSIWFKKGEVLSYNIGGQNGYNGGGSGSQFAGGGGFTSVSTDQKGSIAIAGGGGGATSLAGGGAGGSSASNISSGQTGQSGAAGGGGGKLGGTAGEVVRHYHNESCYRTYSTAYSYYKGATDTSAEVKNNVGNPLVWYTNSEAQYGTSEGIGEMFYAINYKTAIYAGGHTKGESGGRWMYLCAADGSYNIPVKKNTSVYIQWWKNNWSDFGGDLKLYVLDQNGKEIYCESTAGTYSGTIARGSWVAIPADATSIQIRLYNDWGGNENAWINMGISEVTFYGGTQTDRICAYAVDGQVISSKASYGGSSYINTAFASNYSQEAGKKEGNGSITLVSDQIGYVDALSLKGVKATDLAAPDIIVKNSVKKSAENDKRIRITWSQPEDFGTVYYHKVQSYLPGKKDVLSTSNVTVNTLTSGIAGYYYVTDGVENTVPSAVNGNWTIRPEAYVDLEGDRQYVHISAVDKAGNEGPAVHIPVGRKDEEVAWPVMTDRIEVSSDKDSIYPTAQTDTYYVRCDGKTPFALSFKGFLTSEATAKYQVNHTIFDTFCEGNDPVRLDIYTPSCDSITNNVITVDASGLTKTVSGRPFLDDAAYTVTKRSDFCKTLHIVQKFTAAPSLDGKTITVIPGAGADFGQEIVYSDKDKDADNAVKLIGDGVPPQITGTELLENLSEHWNGEGSITLTFGAHDEGSGIREFYAEAVNEDNGTRQTFSGENAVLKLDIDSGNVLFQGNYTVRFHAVDNVGNETLVTTKNEDFSLDAWVERILEPHTPIFKGGESGILHIEAFGYAQRVEVEFGEELTDDRPELNCIFTYEQPEYLEEEQITFMIPLGMLMGEHNITVRAYKGERSIEQKPVFSTLGEDDNILGEIRTRLR